MCISCYCAPRTARNKSGFAHSSQSTRRICVIIIGHSTSVTFMHNVFTFSHKRAGQLLDIRPYKSICFWPCVQQRGHMLHCLHAARSLQAYSPLAQSCSIASNLFRWHLINSNKFPFENHSSHNKGGLRPVLFRGYSDDAGFRLSTCLQTFQAVVQHGCHSRWGSPGGILLGMNVFSVTVCACV